jgi:KDO2-lipid IV(A) lauroyltransferase
MPVARQLVNTEPPATGHRPPFLTPRPRDPEGRGHSLGYNADCMRQRSALRNRIEYCAALAAVKSLEWAPLGAAHWLARGYAGLLDLAMPRLRRVAYRNLQMALPEASRPEIVDGVFRSIARLLVTFAKFPSIRQENLSRWIRCEGVEHFDAALRAGRGVLFATAHLGNWELSAFAHALLAAPMNVIARPLDNPLIDTLVERRRALTGNRLLFKKDFARGILKALASNQAVGILIDQNSALDKGVFVKFFGIPACAGTGFAKIAAHSGAAVIPGFALWSEQERRYVLRFYPPVPVSGDAGRDTQALQCQLEEAIRAHPDQWLWIHRRWKTRPPGEAPLYEGL